MKKILISGMTAALLAVAGCSSPSTSNKTTTNTTTTTNRSTTTTNTSNSTSSNAGQSNSNSTSNTSRPTSENAEGKQDFTLHNATGVTIHRVYVSPHDQNDWGEDILGQDTLADGQSVHITFSPKEHAAMWDLKVEDSSGNSIEWENLNLLEISDVTLHYQNGHGTAETR